VQSAVGWHGIKAETQHMPPLLDLLLEYVSHDEMVAANVMSEKDEWPWYSSCYYCSLIVVAAMSKSWAPCLFDPFTLALFYLFQGHLLPAGTRGHFDKPLSRGPGRRHLRGNVHRGGYNKSRRFSEFGLTWK
jgi:hypothetical protein